MLSLKQIGQQNLAFGLKFNAKGTVECYEKDLVHLPFGRRRDIEFKMIEGDFQTFEGKWSIVQVRNCLVCLLTCWFHVFLSHIVANMLKSFGQSAIFSFTETSKLKMPFR